MTVSDAAGNTASASATFLVTDPTVVNAPIVSLLSPTAEQVIKTPTPVFGTVSDPHLLSYTLTARLYVTMPGGKREGFTFRPIPRTLFGAVFGYIPNFVPDPGVVDQLEPPQTDMQLFGNDYVVEEDDGLIDYNPQDPELGDRYDVVTPQGIDYATTRHGSSSNGPTA